MSESHHIEFKRELTDDIEVSVIAFLNSRMGGQIFVGRDENGSVFPITQSDETQLKIKDRLKHNIQPSCMGLFDIVVAEIDGHPIIRIDVASGPEKPYFLRKFGMSEKGAFIRVGSASEPMPQRQIETLYARRVRNSIGAMLSPRKNLTFNQLKIYYEEKGKALNDQFLANLELLTPEEALNYAAYLLADENGVSIKVAKYAGTDRVDLIENYEFGYCSLIKAADRVLDRLYIENRTFTKITGAAERLVKRLYEPVAVREAVINAFVHNDYSFGAPPKFELFADRLEITSVGGLPDGMTEDEFFAGLSMPRNKELMRVFRDLELVEQLGSGVARILESYDRSCFRFTDNFLRITVPFATPFEGETSVKTSKTSVKTSKTSVKTSETSEKTKKASEKTSGKILELLTFEPYMTIAEMAGKIGISSRSVERNLANLQQAGLLKRIGGDKGGHWKVLEVEK
jgi:predicted HTH transcriptional regulator